MYKTNYFSERKITTFLLEVIDKPGLEPLLTDFKQNKKQCNKYILFKYFKEIMAVDVLFTISYCEHLLPL